MNLLHANDRSGEYPASFYASDLAETVARSALEGERKADVAIIGGGYTGLSAALRLAERGYDVVVLEAHRAGWGASGRNGGQVGSGQRLDQMALESLFGKDRARALWDLGEEAKACVKALVAEHDIDCKLKPGILAVNHRARYDAESRALADHMQDAYRYPLCYLTPSEVRERLGTTVYSGGTIDPDAAHLDPLAYALGLARAAETAGARIFETSEVKAISPGAKVRISTDAGTVHADHAILACNGYLCGLQADIAAKVMPINNFVIATEPLSEDLARELIRDDCAVVDSRFVVNYYRLSHDNRLIFGGGESYGYRFPRDIAGLVRQSMLKVYPQLARTEITHAWGGTLAITLSRLPHLARLGPNIWSASGYSGQGVALATFSGRLMADAIAGTAEKFDLMAGLPHKAMPGGRAGRQPLLVAAMLWYRMLDRI